MTTLTQPTVWRVPRSRAFQTHETMRADILSALEPALFGSMQDGYAIRARFEQSFAEAVGQAHAISVHSGTIGLFLALRACGVGPGDEVITVGNSDISTTAAIRQCGALPVLCDSLDTDFTINVTLVERLITGKTRALLPVDLYGHPADVRSLRALADAHSLKIVEDAALATGARDYGQPVGAYADAAVFSFAPFKPLGSVGNGATVVTGNPEIAARLHRLAHYGHAPDADEHLPGHQYYDCEGYNVPLDTLQAALLTVKLPHLAEWTAKRQAVAQAYAAGLAGTAVQLPTFRAESSPTFRAYTIRVDRQAEIYRGLRAAGVEAVLHYTPPAYRHTVYAGALPGSEVLPVTDRAARELVSLPVAAEFSDEDIAYVVTILRELLDSGAGNGEK